MAIAGDRYFPGRTIETPIRIIADVECNDESCRITGNVSVKLTVDGTMYESTMDISEQRVENTIAANVAGPSVGRRRSLYSISASLVSESTNATTTTTTDSIEHAEPFHFPSLNTARHAAKDLAHKMWDASKDAYEYLHFWRLPDWMKDNEFLHYFHRPPTPSFVDCFKSIFRLHTETGNIWTHLLGCALFIGLGVYFLTRSEHHVKLGDKLVFAPFFLGAVVCMGTSFTFHTMICHSPEVGRFFNKLDYVGILSLIVGSYIPWIYYGFYDHPIVRMFYLVMVLVLGIVVLVVSLTDKFSQAKYRVLRALAFACFGLFGIVPFLHFFRTHGYHPSLIWLGLMGTLYLLGAFLYASRIPERFFPGKFDLWCQSHQIHHVCVVVAAVVHYYGISILATQRPVL